MISYKQFIDEKIAMKKLIENLLFELEHKDYYMENSKYGNSDAIYIRWFKEKAPIQIHEFRKKFEDRHSDKYILEYNESNIEKIEYYIVKRDRI